MDINKVRKEIRDLQNIINPLQERPELDWTYYLDNSNFIRSVLFQSKYGQQVSTYSDLEVREFCRQHNLHTDIDIVEFTINNL